MNEQEKLEFAKEEIKRLKEWLGTTEKIWKGQPAQMETDDPDGFKESCQRNENLMIILEDYVSEKEKNGTCDIFPEVVGEDIEMLFEGEWVRGKVVKGYRFKDGIVTMETEDGKTIWCGQDRTDIYRRPVT